MRKRSWGFIVGGMLVALLLAGVVSNYASAHPDGLDSSLRAGCTFDADDEITGGSCPAQQEKEHEIGGPLADYGIAGLDNDFLSTGLSGVLGVLLTFAVAGGAFWLVRRRGSAEAPDAAGSRDAAQPSTAATGQG
ncbi:cobalamin biosynthesis protein CbiM [Micromonospora craterilacus]|uniref:Cobalamin biosynthesis protein CbiM n=1 Tax=Micromonospora craterilacus TaxID=1655439 RepID=A0A2W2ERK5_9ACTN|nr:PDGLE domain-containing protein [Micromonospora craterilacus]PZG16160.1 cobalamin biosynthesis protein CbiM [Micromonospora craterilacus]